MTTVTALRDRIQRLPNVALAAAAPARVRLGPPLAPRDLRPDPAGVESVRL